MRSVITYVQIGDITSEVFGRVVDIGEATGGRHEQFTVKNYDEVKKLVEKYIESKIAPTQRQNPRAFLPSSRKVRVVGHSPALPEE